MKELPHDLLAEKSLIGCLILDGLVYDEISDLGIVKEDFFHPQYGIIYDCIKDLALTQSPIDYITVCSKLSAKGQLEAMGGKNFVLEISEDQASAANVYHYAKIVKDKSSIRRIIRTATKVAETGMSYSGNAEDFISDVEANFFQLTNEAKTGGMAKLNTFLKDKLKSLEDASRKCGEIAGLPTGYNQLDEILLGMQPGQLIILAARPAMGKTSLALNIATHVSGLGFPVAIFSLEMLASELCGRILSARSRVESAKFRTKNFLPNDLKDIGMAIQDLSAFPIYINDSGTVTLPDIQSQCRKIKAEYGLGMVIIDYLQLMKSHSNNPSREQQISEISRGLKTMAKELECPVIALSQLNRAVEARPNKRPNLSDIRESGAIEQDADIVMFIYRDEVYNPESKEPGVAEVIIGKNRAGKSDTAKLAFLGNITSFENLAFERTDPNYL